MGHIVAMDFSPLVVKRISILWYPPKLKHWVTIWVEPLALVHGDGFVRLSPKLKHWVTICAEPLALVHGERIP